MLLLQVNSISQDSRLGLCKYLGRPYLLSIKNMILNLLMSIIPFLYQNMQLVHLF